MRRPRLPQARSIIRNLHDRPCPPPPCSLSEPVSLDNENACCETIIGGCSGALAGYPTTAAEDDSLLKRGGLDKRRASPLLT